MPSTASSSSSDADAWMRYQKAYGTGGGRGASSAAMMNHVNLMSRDIAAMEVLSDRTLA